MHGLKYNLGDEVEDLITEFRGTIVMIYLYLHEPPRYLIQPKCDVSFILPEPQAFCEARLILITDQTLKAV